MSKVKKWTQRSNDVQDISVNSVVEEVLKRVEVLDHRGLTR